MSTLLTLAAALGAATIGGVFFAFSTFVMTALGQLPPTQGMAAMQRINVVVLNPMFLGTFVGTAVLQGLVVVLALAGWGSRPSTLLLIGAGLYIAGCFGVTVACNVPRNEQLMALTPESPAAHDYWRAYQREWTAWNHVRTVAALAAAGCGIAALVGGMIPAGPTHASSPWWKSWSNAGGTFTTGC